MLNEAGGASPLEQAVFSLQDKLQEASLLEGRPGAIDALFAVAEFLSVISSRGDLQHQRPINELISALISLDDGKVLPLLEPISRRGGSRNSVAKESAKGFAIFVVRRMCDAGLAVDDAFEKVAAVCRQAGICPGRKGATYQKSEMTNRTVRKWDSDISADVGCRTRAGVQFNSLMSVPLLGGPAAPDVLLGRLRRFLVDTRSGDQNSRPVPKKTT
jgi:hypothetical protein